MQARPEAHDGATELEREALELARRVVRRLTPAEPAQPQSPPHDGSRGRAAG